MHGDIFLAESQAVGLGLNAAGRLDVSPLMAALQDRYPVFASDYHKRSRAGQLAPGTIWVWRESTPWIVGLIVRDTPQGPARPRYVESVMLNLVKNWEREGLRSLALMRLTDAADWAAAREIVTTYTRMMRLQVVIYEDFEPGVKPATEPESPSPDC